MSHFALHTNDILVSTKLLLNGSGINVKAHQMQANQNLKRTTDKTGTTVNMHITPIKQYKFESKRQLHMPCCIINDFSDMNNKR